MPTVAAVRYGAERAVPGLPNIPPPDSNIPANSLPSLSLPVTSPTAPEAPYPKLIIPLRPRSPAVAPACIKGDSIGPAYFFTL